MASRKKVLIYTPYGYWDLHTAYEITIGHALRLRGAEVRFIGCDAQFTDCDVAWAAVNPRKPDTCRKCIEASCRIFDAMKMPLEWLGAFVTEADRQEAKRSVDALRNDELLRAHFRGRPIGDWVRSSLHTHFRMNELDLGDPTIVAGYRSYIYSGSIALAGLEVLLDSFQPDSMLLLGGRLFSHRIALELGVSRGIPVLLHERGVIDNSLWFWQDVNCHSRDGFREFYDKWKDVSLTEEQIEHVDRIMYQRESGNTTGWQKKFTTLWEGVGEQTPEETKEELGIKRERRVVALFTSSEDEHASLNKRDVIIEQEELIQRAVLFFRDRPQYHLLIRIHPNMTGPLGVNKQFMNWFRQYFERGLPDNVSVVWPQDKVNTYNVVRTATHCLALASTLIIESIIRGTPAMVHKRSYFDNYRFAPTLSHERAFEQELDEFLKKQITPEAVRHAYRFAYTYFVRFSILFPLINVVNVHGVQTNFNTLEELLPGKDASLDLICENLLDGKPVYRPPTEREFISTTAEDQYLAKRFSCHDALLLLS